MEAETKAGRKKKRPLKKNDQARERKRDCKRQIEKER